MLFARKDGIVSSLQSKYGSGTVAMSINDSARWLSRVNLAVAIIMIGWGLSVILTQPVTRWFATSSAVWMALLLMSAIWQLRGSFIAIAALALATAVVSRLFSILRLNPRLRSPERSSSFPLSASHWECSPARWPCSDRCTC